MIATALAVAIWQPAGLQPSTARIADVLARVHAAQTLPPADAQRRERWTYRVGTAALPVRVAVRGGDYRADVTINGEHYDAGVLGGIPWRADGNGIAHATTGDEQGDPADRLPRALFAFEDADCTLAGEVHAPTPQWVVRLAPPADRPHWLFVDEASGRIVREQTREGKRVVTIEYADFAPSAGAERPRRWHVSGDDHADDIDVTLDAVEPGAVSADDVALPAERRFAAPVGTPGSVGLPVAFNRMLQTYVDVEVNGHRARFILDSGTQSLMIDTGLARRWGLPVVLGHTAASRAAVGPYALEDASLLVVPIGWADGIIGYDFFVGHVLHVDYARGKVELLTPDAAAPTFADPRVTVVPASFDEGLPLVAAEVDGAVGQRFALDTGSEQMLVGASFADANSGIVRRWTPDEFPRTNRSSLTLDFLEGSVAVVARRVTRIRVGPLTFKDWVVGLQIDDDRDDAIPLPFDGIIGTEWLHHCELWFDYADGRIAMLPERQ